MAFNPHDWQMIMLLTCPNSPEFYSGRATRRWKLNKGWSENRSKLTYYTWLSLPWYFLFLYFFRFFKRKMLEIAISKKSTCLKGYQYTFNSQKWKKKKKKKNWGYNGCRQKSPKKNHTFAVSINNNDINKTS